MRRQSILLLLLVTGCASHDGVWPSLAPRPIEGPLPVATGRCAERQPSCASSAAVTASPSELAGAAPVANSPPVAIDDITARLAVIDRDLTEATARLTTQRTAGAAAKARARAAKADSDAQARAEVERTALDRIGNQIDAIRGRLDAIAGTLAAASAGGTDVGMSLTATGRLIARATAVQTEYSTAAAALR